MALSRIYVIEGVVFCRKPSEKRQEVAMSKRKKASRKITNDDVYHALGRKYPRLLLAVANEAHGTSYTGEEKVAFGNDEHYQQERNGGVKKRVSDTHLVVNVQEAATLWRTACRKAICATWNCPALLWYTVPARSELQRN